VPFTGLSTSEVLRRFISIIDRSDRSLFVVLDEVDTLVKKTGDDMLYKLTRINDKLSRTRISIVGITNDLKFTEYLDARVRSSLGEEELIFPPYNAAGAGGHPDEEGAGRRSRGAGSTGGSSSSAPPLQPRSTETRGGRLTCSG